MTYRPYPNPDRARRQLDRHNDETPPTADGSAQPPTLFGPVVISEEARAAIGARLAEVGASLKSAFRHPTGILENTG